MSLPLYIFKLSVFVLLILFMNFYTRYYWLLVNKYSVWLHIIIAVEVETVTVFKIRKHKYKLSVECQLQTISTVYTMYQGLSIPCYILRVIIVLTRATDNCNWQTETYWICNT